MPVFYPYKNKVDISDLVAGDNSWHNVNIDQYLVHQAAKGVILEFTSDVAGQPVGGGMGINQLNDAWSVGLYRYGWMSEIVRFRTAASTKEARIKRGNSDVKVFIVGELLNGVEFHQNTGSVDITPADAGEVNTWVDHTLTLIGDDTYDDIEAALVMIFCTNDAGQMSIRKKGATGIAAQPAEGTQGIYWFPVGIDENGQYQTYLTGKVDPFAPHFNATEIGYIKKGTFHALEEPQVETGLSANSWNTLSLDGTVPRGARVVVSQWSWLSGTVSIPYGYLREFGSTNDEKRMDTQAIQASQATKLDVNRQCEYYTSDTDQDLYILGYEDFSAGGASTSANGLVIDGGTVNIGG